MSFGWKFLENSVYGTAIKILISNRLPKKNKKKKNPKNNQNEIITASPFPHPHLICQHPTLPHPLPKKTLLINSG